MTDDKLEIIPLGGVGEFGLNMMAMRCAGETIIIDAGMGFPEHDVHGVNTVIPDFSFVDKYRQEITAVLLTHGHEDHIGAVPFLLREIKVPVYGTDLTIARLDRKLIEHGLAETAMLYAVDTHRRLKLGVFEIELIHVSHSLTCSTALAITTPAGVVIHSGDLKVDHTPIVGPSIDLKRLADYGDRGVLALLSDSTNAEVPGRTPSERAVIPAFEKLFAEAEGRIVITCFTTSIHRIQIVLDLAREFGRSIVLLGRSMVNSVDIAEGLRQLDVPDGILKSPAAASRLPHDELVLLVAGSQGEPRSAMSRIATDQHKNFSVGEGDLVIHSARVIPGNERSITRLISHCYRRGARVVDNSIARVHVSGHANQEDLRIIVEATRPKFLIPIHGEFRQLYRQRDWAAKEGIVDPGNIIMFENGDVLEIDSSTARIVGKEIVGRTFIDQAFGEVEDMVLRDRRHLSYDGIVITVVAINPTSGQLESEPEIATRGFIHEEDESEMLGDLKRLVEETVNTAAHEERIDYAVIKEKIRLALKRFIQKATGRRPMIIPVVVEV